MRKLKNGSLLTGSFQPMKMGLITSEMVQISENDKWINYNFKTYYYNNGHFIEEFEQFWNDLKLRWEDNYRKLYSYDSEGRLIQITHQNIFKGKYINSSQGNYDLHFRRAIKRKNYSEV